MSRATRQKAKSYQDWYQAESEVLENKVLGPLYRRLQATAQEDAAPESPSSCETCA